MIMKHEKVIFRLAWFFILIFLSMVVYLVKFTLVDSQTMVMHPANGRFGQMEEAVIRGTIYDAEGHILAQEKEGVRVYPYDELYAHTVGYSNMGKYGIEAQTDSELLRVVNPVKSLFEVIRGQEKLKGHDVVLTLNHTVQQAVAEAFGTQKGAAVVLEPTTGKILAMYANPTFNPNTLSQDWESLVRDTEESPLLNRATQGLYPPASVFKMITTLSFLEQIPEDSWDALSYNCTGEITHQNHTIHCYNGVAHGQINLKQAFSQSCNTFFIHLNKQVSPEMLAKTAKRLLFEMPLPVSFPYSQSRLGTLETLKQGSIESYANYIGQGQILVSPLHMAMVASIIYNDGVLMEPYMVDYSIDDKGKERMKNLPTYNDVYLNTTQQRYLKSLMIGVVAEGTGQRLAKQGLRIGVKTGTAENETNEDHSWVVGFAESINGNHTPISFAVIVEQGGAKAAALDVVEKLFVAHFD